MMIKYRLSIIVTFPKHVCQSSVCWPRPISDDVPRRWLNAWVSSTPAPLKTRPTTVKPELDYEPETSEPIVAHIVKTKPGEDAAAKVLEARIYGTPLEALCGHVWVPSRDPKQVPMCQACKEIYETYRMFNDNLNESPSE